MFGDENYENAKARIKQEFESIRIQAALVNIPIHSLKTGIGILRVRLNILNYLISPHEAVNHPNMLLESIDTFLNCYANPQEAILIAAKKGDADLIFKFL